MHINDCIDTPGEPIIEPFECIVLSGGGLKGLITLGILDYYYKKGEYIYSKTKIYIGPSVGSGINLLLVSGYTPVQIFAEIYKIENFVDIFSVNNIGNIKKNMGILSLDGFITKIERLIMTKLNIKYVPTLLELYQITNKQYIVPVTNVTKSRCDYYSYLTKPHIKCTEAVRRSCSIPVIFKRLKCDGEYLIDGAITDNFPIRLINDNYRKILGIIVSGKVDEKEDLESPDKYFLKVLYTPITHQTKLSCDNIKDNVTLIKAEWISPLQSTALPSQLMTMNNDVKKDMFMFGHKYAEYIDHYKYVCIKEWDEL